MSTSDQGTGAVPSLGSIVGSNIRRERLALGKTQREFAVLLGGKVSGQQVSDWERGAYRPSDVSLQRLSEVLGRDFAWFFVDHDDERAAA